MSSKKVNWLKFDDESLEMLVNELYDDIRKDTTDVKEHIKRIAEQFNTSNTIMLENYGLQYVETLRTKGQISDRLQRLANLILQKNKADQMQSAKSADSPAHTSPEQILEILQKLPPEVIAQLKSSDEE